MSDKSRKSSKKDPIRRARRRRLRMILFGCSALALGTLAGVLVHLGVRSSQRGSAAASSAPVKDTSAPMALEEATSRGRRWSRLLHEQFLTLVEDLRQRSPAPAGADPTLERVKPGLVEQGRALLEILRAPGDSSGVLVTIAAGAVLYVELVGRLGYDPGSDPCLIAEELRAELGRARQDPIDEKVRQALQPLLEPPRDGAGDAAIAGRSGRVLQLATALRASGADHLDPELASQIIDLVLGIREDDNLGKESIRTVLELVPAWVVDPPGGTTSRLEGAVEYWRLRHLLSVVASLAHRTPAEGPGPSGASVRAAVSRLIDLLHLLETRPGDPIDARSRLGEFTGLPQGPGEAPRVRVALVRLWLHKALERFEEDAKKVNLAQPWTATQMLSSGHQFLETSNVIAGPDPLPVEGPDWIAIYDASDRGLGFLEEFVGQYSQFLPPTIVEGVRRFEGFLKESEAPRAGEVDPLRSLLAASIRLTARGRVAAILDPSPTFDGREVTKLDERLCAWAAPDWLASKEGAGIRRRILSLSRFLGPADAARPGLEAALRDLGP